MIKKSIGLAVLVATGSGLLLTVELGELSPLNITILTIVGYFSTISLFDHYKNLKEGE